MSKSALNTPEAQTIPHGTGNGMPASTAFASNTPTEAPTRESRYRFLLDAVKDFAIFMVDPHGTVDSWNAGAERLTGYLETEALGLNFAAFYLQEERNAGGPAQALVQSATQGRCETEGWRVRKNGSKFWAHSVVEPIRAEDGHLVGHTHVTRDLSERLAAADALQQSETQFRMLVQGVTDYALYMLDPEGRIVNWNAGAQRIKGYAAAEVIGTNFARFYRSDDQKKGEPAAALATAVREGRFEAQAWRVRKDGSEFRAHVVIDPIRDESGRLVGFAKITRDVTAQQHAQQELEQAQEALFQAQKLDAIGQLTGGVAHDFNNLLMVIMSSLALVKRRLPADDRLQQLLDNALNGARRGAALTQRMLAFARRQELKPTVVHLPALVEGMTDMLTRSLGSAVQIATELPVTLSPVLVDANQLELALLNLAVNARDAMPEGGRLRIRAVEAEMEGGRAGQLPPGRYVSISVIDSGEGMDAATLAHAAEPFFTTKGPGKGTGLGLPMVHGLAAQSGGRFELLSQPGTGTTATLWLPVASEARAESEPPQVAAQESASAAPQLVLVVDDDPLVLNSTCALLEELGHSVLRAGSADDALRILRRIQGIAVLVTDHVMPHMSGAQLVEAVAQEQPELPVVLATGYAELITKLPAGAVRLAKPFDQAALQEAIAEALRRKNLVQ